MDEAAVVEALREVIDPEVGVNVVDLGLVYGVRVDAADVRVTMTMTTPACPLASLVRDEAQAAIRARVPGVRSIDVQVTYAPPWTVERVTPEGRRQLGWSV